MADVTGKIPNVPNAMADPLLTFMFSVEGTTTGGLNITGYFTEVSGPTKEVALVKLVTVGYQGASKGKTTKFYLPGISGGSLFTLKRGITNDMTFWKWWKLVSEGKMSQAKASVSITAYNRRYEPLLLWYLDNAWPTKVTAPELKAGSSEFGVEEITLAYGGLGIYAQKDDKWETIIGAERNQTFFDNIYA